MTTSTAKPGKYLSFLIKNQLFAVPVESIWEINKIDSISPLPLSEPYIAGAINLRGKVLAVVDLSVRLQMGKTELSKNSCVIILESKVGRIGAIVDAVCSVVDLSQNEIEPPPQYDSVDTALLFSGFAKVSEQMLMILDVASALSKLSIPTETHDAKAS
ncbi:MAG: chemotaxis protein CheW [Chitinophagaceae bacterium]|nr:chemotaxis protein CheW [Oligoflexus sp.]